MGKTWEPHMLNLPAQWSENWTDWHAHGLECIVSSGRIATGLFTESLSGSMQRIMEMIPDREPGTPWINFVGGRLLAGAGAEFLLKALYLKNGYSIRNPESGSQLLIRREAPEVARYDPYVSASFGILLRNENLQLVGDPKPFRPLMVATWWRDDAAHSTRSGGDAGIQLVKLGLSLRRVHDILLEDSDAGHRAKVDAILRDTRPIWPLTT